MPPKRKQAEREAATSWTFFDRLVWIDGKPLLDTVERYRRDIFTDALDSFRPDGLPKYNLVVSGRGKKNWKSSNLILAALYKLLIPKSYHGSDGFIVGNDEGQAADDLSLAKKLVEANPNLRAELEVYQKEIRRRDGRGALEICQRRTWSGSTARLLLSSATTRYMDINRGTCSKRWHPIRHGAMLYSGSRLTTQSSISRACRCMI